MNFKIDPKIFAKWPDVKLGVTIVTGLKNNQNQSATYDLLCNEVLAQRILLKDIELQDQDFIKVWKKAYEDFGASSKKYPSSIDALLRRVLDGKDLPDINPLVNIYNYLSLKYHLPFGGEDLDKVKGNIELTEAIGTENGIYLGSDKVDTALAGEVIYKDDLGFICRRWNWREAKRTAFNLDSKNVILINELLPPIGDDVLVSANKELIELINKYLGGNITTSILSKDNTVISVDFTCGSKITSEDTNQLEKKSLSTQPENVSTKAEKKLDFPKVGTIAYKLAQYVFQSLNKIYTNGKHDFYSINIEHPSNNQFGDYTSNIAMILAKELKKSPNEIAIDLKTKLEDIIDNKIVLKIDVVGGYINFFLTKDYLVKEVEKINTGELTTTLKSNRAGKKYLIEHTSPEPTKTLHIGHFRNNFLGISIHNILETLGAEVTLDCIDNDRGMKICKTMWGYLMLAEKSKINALGLQEYNNRLINYKINDEDIYKLSQDFDWKQKLSQWILNPTGWLIPDDVGLSSDKFDNILYSPAHKASELISNGMQEIQEILKLWENEDVQIRKLWRQIIDWSTLGYERTYKRIGSFHDKVWHESEFYKIGKDWVDQGLKKGIFKKLPDGGVLTNLESYKLPDTIVMKRDDTSMYMTQDFQLTYLKVNTFPSDLYIWDIGNDQQLYLQQMFTVCDQLGIISKDKLFHLNYGFITLKGGARMGSRFGGVINGDDLLDELKDKIKKFIIAGENKNKVDIEEISEKIAVAACKFGFLKISREKDFSFDPDESVSIEGSSGPYLLYTYARCQSVLEKAIASINKDGNFNQDEIALIQELFKYEEKIVEAANKYNPSIIAEYLLSIARGYNEFYGKYRIIGQPEESSRLWLTTTTANILKSGLGLLGIETVDRM